jgi:hypothetical protein
MAVIGIDPGRSGCGVSFRAVSPRPAPEIPGPVPELEPDTPVEIPPPAPEAQPVTVPEIPLPVPELPTPPPPE